MSYQLVYAKKFVRQYRKLERSGNKRILLALDRVINKLEQGESLPFQNHTHRLAGNLACFYECHVSPDWLLIYQVHEDILILELIATGTHSELFR
ncbi:MAG: type II toxin-antitoxin system YafQ family toxin [Candidatus Magasanikbacteria bacterium]|nr:type II toxin-antitoxin system YafQ family toxin [Candidatus Magasanikbacteria bacterium]